MRVKTLDSTPGGSSNPGRPPYSVVIVTFNTERTNANCIESVLRSLGPTDELIVVDNASTDSTPSYLRSLADPRIQVVLNAENVGYSIGMNQGVRLSKGEFVAMLNPDTQVTSGWLDRLRAHFRDARVGAVGPISDRAGGAQRFEFYVPADMKGGYGVDDIAERVYAANKGRSLEARTLIGFCLFVSRRAMDEVGLLDEELVLGNDDLEYCWRLREAGYKVLVATDVFIRHEEQVSFKSVPSERTARLVQESTDALARKLVRHYGEGKVPTSRELFGVNWFRPSFDLWPNRFQPLSSFVRDEDSGVFRHPEFDGNAQTNPAAIPAGNVKGRVAVLGDVAPEPFAAGEATVVCPSLEACRRWASAGATVYCAWPERVRFEETFAEAVLTPSEDLYGSLEAAARALEPGGRLWVTGLAALGLRELAAALLPHDFEGIKIVGEVVTASAGKR